MRLSLLHLLPLLPATTITTALTLPAPFNSPPTPPSQQPPPLPLLIWHGLGDTYSAPGLTSTATLAARTNPGTDVYIIRLSNSTSLDRRATFFGNVTTQVAAVCDAIKAHPVLSAAPAVNALGFSQGGQFLRGYIQRCEGGPPVRNLVTFGSQHNGIRQFQKCGVGDWVCKSVEGLLGAGAWSAVAQSSLVPAQYFRDAEDLESYLLSSNYLADLNNERPLKNPTYKSRIAALNKFVMYVFDRDETVVPKESGWFAEVNATTGEVTQLRDREIYIEDWLGLRALDEKEGLVFRNVSGEHMQLTEEVLKEVFETYFKPEAVSSMDAQTQTKHHWFSQSSLRRKPQRPPRALPPAPAGKPGLPHDPTSPSHPIRRAQQIILVEEWKPHDSPPPFEEEDVVDWRVKDTVPSRVLRDARVGRLRGRFGGVVETGIDAVEGGRRGREEGRVEESGKEEESVGRVEESAGKVEEIWLNL